MDIKTYSVRMILLVKAAHKKVLPFFRIHFIIPKRHRWITGVPRNRKVVLLHQVIIKFSTFHNVQNYSSTPARKMIVVIELEEIGQERGPINKEGHFRNLSRP